jgi:preflagellin peptidase FlaK
VRGDPPTAVLASWPDLLRLLAVPAFAWVAYRDVRTRRVPNRTWYPLAALALLLLAWELGPVLLSGPETLAERRLLLGTALSVGIVVPLSYGFWLVGGFGGADAKAFFVVALLFPTYPHYALWELGVAWLPSQLPVIRTTLGVFSLTVLSNTVLAGAVYPFVLAGRNAVAGRFSPAMFVARPVAAADTVREYGTLLHFDDRRLRDVRSLSGLRAYVSYRGLDLDALRMYLQYRGLSIEDLRADPDRYRDPGTLPDDPDDPGSGVVTDGGDPDATPDPDTEAGTSKSGGGDANDRPDGHDDPWGAERFLEDIEGSAYGTTPADLREGLDALVTEETVWVSPGIPFLVPLFAGLVVSLTLGDVLFALLGLAGLV